MAHAGLLGAQIALLAIYLSSTIVRTLLRGFTITWFETAQCAVAFLIAVGSSRGPALAVLCLVFGGLWLMLLVPTFFGFGTHPGASTPRILGRLTSTFCPGVFLFAVAYLLLRRR